MVKKASNLLAARVEPWQLFKFKKIIKFTHKRPGQLIMEALQLYSSGLKIPEKTMKQWLSEYHRKSDYVD